MADRAGVAQPVIATYESGRRQPTVPMLAKLLAATGHELDLRVRPAHRGPAPEVAGRHLLMALELAEHLPHPPSAAHLPEASHPVTTVADVVVALHRAFDRAAVPHAFGGAIALAYAVGEPRATIDVDVNVFVPADDAPVAFAALPTGVGWEDPDVVAAQASGQVRVWWDEVPIDLFFDYDPFHRIAADEIRVVPFGDEEIPLLGADELAVFKAYFDRTKHWADIEAMAEVGAYQPRVVEGWLRRLLADDDPRIERLASLTPPADPSTTA